MLSEAELKKQANQKIAGTLVLASLSGLVQLLIVLSYGMLGLVVFLMWLLVTIPMSKFHTFMLPEATFIEGDNKENYYYVNSKGERVPKWRSNISNIFWILAIVFAAFISYLVNPFTALLFFVSVFIYWQCSAALNRPLGRKMLHAFMLELRTKETDLEKQYQDAFPDIYEKTKNDRTEPDDEY